MPADAVVFGEVGLSGEVRAVGQADLRLKEAAKLGFHSAFSPRVAGRKRSGTVTGIETTTLEHLGDLVEILCTPPQKTKPARAVEAL